MTHRPRKRFGQNFLQDLTIIEQLVYCIQPQAHETLVEIGPGLGALTQALLPQVKHLIGIELDRDLIPGLKKMGDTAGNLSIIAHDALTFDFSSLTSPENKGRIVGNLPYNISTPLLFHLIQHIDSITNMHFMLQKEVAERLAAPVNSSAYGQLSVLIQYHCHVENLLAVPPSAFLPAPKVNSAFVRLSPHTKKPCVANDYEQFQYLVKKAFAHPRKTLRNNFKKIFSIEQLASMVIDLNLRPQALSVSDYVAISNSYGNMAQLNGVASS